MIKSKLFSKVIEKACKYLITSDTCSKKDVGTQPEEVVPQLQEEQHEHQVNISSLILLKIMKIVETSIQNKYF